jgi:hypothetical protein
MFDSSSALPPSEVVRAISPERRARIRLGDTQARRLGWRKQRFEQVGVKRDTRAGLPFGADVSDDRFGESDHKAFQLAVLAFKIVQNLFQLSIPINFIETMRRSLL